ncbi:MAG TPA: hypothetical protein VHB21_22885, partial [Minicystis sp.]|nr:hypothetical protein [Minicystis sp.]
ACWLAAPWALVAAFACSSGGGAGAGGSGGGLAPPPATCNGHAELCARRYTDVSYPGTHGSYSDVDEGFGAPDQTHDVARQLEDGIRVLHIEVHDDHGQTVVCHSICAIGERPLTHDLEAVASFLATHPDNVVTVLLERSDGVVTADAIGDAFDEAGLSGATLTLSPGATWPTLGEMIRRRTPIVAFLDDTSGSHHPFLLPRWSFTWETPWDNEQPADFGRCDADRGTQGNDVYVVDTYLEDQLIPTAEHAALVNFDPFLVDRNLDCREQTKTRPNFVMVNFYEVGDLFHVVDVLNGFASAPHDALAGFPPTSWPADAGTD